MLEINCNPAKKAMKQGKKLSASWLQAASNITAEIVAEAGFDVAVIDMEHGPGDIMNLIGQIQALKGLPAVPFVRSPWNDLVVIKRILDAGAYGLIIPYVSSAEEAKRAVAAAQYPTAGVRGIAGSPRAAHYGVAKDYFATANDDICVFVQIETPTAVKNIDEILDVERVDGAFIGPMDLSTGMGHFANPGHEEVQKVILELEKKVLAAGKLLATVASSWEDAKAKYQRGYHMVISFSDTANLSIAARAMADSFKKEFA